MSQFLFYGAICLILLLNLLQTCNFASPIFLFGLLGLANSVGVINHSNPEAARAVFLTLCMSCAGTFLINRITDFSPRRELRCYQNLPLLHTRWKVGLVVWLIFVICLVAAVLIFRKGIPILANNVYEARIALRAGSGLLFRILKVFFPLLGMVLFSQFQLSKHMFKRIFYLGMILVLLIISFLSGDKLSIIMFGGPIIWLYFYLSRPNLRLLVLGLLVGLLLTIELTRLSHDTDLVGALDVLVYRVTVVQTVGLDYIFRSMQPARGEYLIRDLEFLAGSFGLAERPETIDVYLYRTIFGYSGFTVPPTLTGELYVNWGWWGVLLGSLLYGAALQLSYVLLLRSAKSVTTMSFVLYVQFMLLYMSQFATILMTFYFLGIGLLGFGVLYILLYVWVGLPRREMKIPSFSLSLKHCYGGNR